jgi:hypothetical protein
MIYFVVNYAISKYSDEAACHFCLNLYNLLNFERVVEAMGGNSLDSG